MTAQYAASPASLGLLSRPVTTFCRVAFHAICGNNKSGVEHFARCGPDSESTRDSRVRLHVGHGGAKADAHTRDRAYEVGWSIAWWSAQWIWSYGAL